MNLHKGFRRLTWVLSLLAGPIIIIFMLAVGERPYDIADFVIGVLVFSSAGFLIVWAIYLVAFFVAKGFADTSSEQRAKSALNLRRGFRRITLVLAVVAGLSAVLVCVRIVQEKVSSAKSYLHNCQIGKYDVWDEAMARFNVAESQKVKLAELTDESRAEWEARNKSKIKREFELLKMNTFNEAKNNFWLKLSDVELVTMHILLGLGSAVVGYFSTWLIVWFGGLAVYKLVRWIVFGFRYDTDADGEQKNKKKLSPPARRH